MKPTDRQWQALVKRDAAAAGEVLYAVRSTGVFCRPGCPSKAPLRRNVELFGSCAAAEAAGYRACRRCRPHIGS